MFPCLTKDVTLQFKITVLLFLHWLSLVDMKVIRSKLTRNIHMNAEWLMNFAEVAKTKWAK